MYAKDHSLDEAWGILYSANDETKLYLTDRKETYSVKNGKKLTSAKTATSGWTQWLFAENAFIIHKSELPNEQDMRIQIEPRLKGGMYIDGKLTNQNKTVENGRCDIFVPGPNLHLIFEALCDVSEDSRLNQVGSNYRYISKLGKGHFGEVYKAIETEKEEFVAIKLEKKSNRKKLEAEYELLKFFSHENVIKCLGFIDGDKQQYLVFELAGGGSLKQKVVHGDEMNESIARFLFRQIFTGVEFIHKKGGMHRDIKPDNIVLMSTDNYSIAKIIDFGVSANDGGALAKRNVVGAYRFLAPELLAKYNLPMSATDKRVVYSNKIDIWSLGICMFVTLTKVMPYQYTQDLGVYRTRIQQNKIDRMTEGYAKMSRLVKDLIYSCLTFDDTHRPSVKECLAHKWFHQVG